MDPDADSRELTKTVNEFMEDLRNCDGIVVDVRFNHGGYDTSSELIASRFGDTRRVGFSKQAIYGNGRTKLQPIYLEPEGDYQFTKPVVLLTSESTISAGEIFTLFMMSLPHVTRMGEPTQGVLSDVLEKALPNGWQIGLSNEIYAACDGASYEGAGIPVDVAANVYDKNKFYERIVELVEDARLCILNKVQK